MPQDYIKITIPALPPGANRTYHKGIALTKEARRWDARAALIVGATAAEVDFEPDLKANYIILIRWWGGKHDADAHLKFVQDCVTRKLGFDDRQISACVIERRPPGWGDTPEGVEIHLFRAIERDWIAALLDELGGQNESPLGLGK